MSLTGQPIIILKENSERTKGREAQRNNIGAASAIAEAVRSTLGPRGMDKMLVDSLGDVVITNDGATILEELDVEHPAAKLIIQVAKSQDKEVGDGTTTAVVIAGELLKKGDELLEKKVHGTKIVAGYKKASKVALESLNEIVSVINVTDKNILSKIAITALNSKSVHMAKSVIADIAVNAILKIKEEDNDKLLADLDNIKILQKQGKGLADSYLMEGIAIDKEVLHQGMPKNIVDAKIALLNMNVEVTKTEFDAEIRISDPMAVQSFLDNEEKMIRDMVEKITATKANVLICQKGIDDLAQHFLSKQGVMAIRRVKKSDMEKISRATGARIVTSLQELSAKDLGTAGKVYETKLGDDDYIYIEECPSPKAVTVVLRGASKYATDEAERALHDALSVVRNVIEDGKMVYGGGAAEIHMYHAVKALADNTTGKEKLAIEKFAEALLIIPSTLAENSGLDPLDIISELTAAFSSGKKNVGLDLSAHHEGGKIGKIANMKTAGVFEPLRVKVQAIKSASEAAELILRIDDVIATKSTEGAGMPPGGMPDMGGMGGMGGMPPGMM
ncbi:MAG: Thermosome subunit alpha [Candidatus Heimdallarchaeota archaeon LC_2]|nr:MAG: Thermosome subunit alpha [Candidatus Heimdallarchaeota archaeon LC_2]